MDTVSPRGAVIGTGRSGTGYMAALLKAAGLDTGHEAYWHAHEGPRASQLDMDSSWLALPHIEAGPWAGPVLHVVRHPVATVRSLLPFFARPNQATPYVMYARSYAYTVHGRYDLEAAVAFWCEWNARCHAVADATVCLEDAPTPEFAKTVAAVFPFADPGDVHAAAATVPKDVNTRGATPEVDPAEVWRLIGRRAHAFGYGA